MPRRILRAARRQLAGAADGVFVQRVMTPSAKQRERVEGLGHDSRMAGLELIAAFYDRPGFDEPDGGAFTRRDQVRPQERRVRRFGDSGEVVDLRWESGFSPLWSDAEARRHFDRPDIGIDGPTRERLLQTADAAPARDYDLVEDNRHMHVRWFRHGDRPRPCAVLIHGFMGGRFRLEEAIWPARTFYEGGMDVVLTTLPLHGRRRDPARRLTPPQFPASDPRLAVEGFRHMVHDHLSLFDYLLDGRVQSLGVAGMSLGGYSAALLSTLDPRLQFGIFHIPLSSVADFAFDSGRMVGTAAQQAQQTEALRRAYALISPMRRPSLLPPERCVITAGEADAITGLGHAHRLAVHFNAETSTFPGGHLIQLGRAEAFKPAWRMLERAGLYAR